MKKKRIITRIRQVSLLVIATVFLLTAQTQLASANLTSDDIQAVLNNWPAWVAGDKLTPDTCSNSEAGTIIKTEGKGALANIEYAFKYLRSKGLSPEQAAGIVGNLRQESGVNPASDNTAAKASSISPSSIIAGVQEKGGGVAQWEDYRGTPTRWTGSSGLLNFVAGKGDFSKPQGTGKNWKVLSIQMDFMWGEVTHAFKNNKQDGLKEVKATSSVDAATVAWEQAFERAGTPNMPRRVKLANEVFEMATKKGWINDNIVTAPEDDTSTTGTCDDDTGGTVANVDGYVFPMAPQKKKNYGTLPCEKGIKSGPYTKNYVYTDRYGNSTKGEYCHHDATPAFDLMDGDGGSKVYAITNGTIVKTTSCYALDGGPCVPGCSTIQLHANNGNDKKYYWYGHLQNVTVHAGQAVTAGKPIAQTATRKYGSSCWGGGPHLHIDRGCSDGNTPKTAGNKDCRDPSFMPLLKKIWDGLPS